MPDYQLGKLYVVRNTVNEKLYVGSTTMPLCKRMAQHRSMAKRKPHFKLYVAFNEIGVENFYIELLVVCPCATKEELHRAEGEKIRELNVINEGYNCINAGTFDQIQCSKKHYEANKAAVLARGAARFAALTPEQIVARNLNQNARYAFRKAQREAANILN